MKPYAESIYNITGSVNTFFIRFSLLGIWAQLAKIRQRKRESRIAERPTAIFSLDHFSVGFFAYLSFFVYGYSIIPFNH